MTRLFPVLWCAIFATSATGHEFWIEPERYQVPTSGQIQARLKNGEEFEGVSLAYFERRIARFDLVTGDTARAVEARSGDNPALDMIGPTDGLVVVVHETTPSSLTYKEWAKFQRFADHKDFADIEARHAANGFPAPPFKERYTRHAKSLIAVGDGLGRDRATGLKTEFVALSNPYAPDFGDVMDVLVTLDGQARADAQVEVFERAPDDTVSITLYRTDAAGIASVPVQPGHAYLFDAVAIAPVTDGGDIVWETYWAALTFAVPE